MKLSFVKLDGSDEEVELHVCDSKDDDHIAMPRLATRRCFWPTVVGEDNSGSEYCEHCAKWMTKVAEAMGFTLHSVGIPLPPMPVERRPIRSINLQGVPKL